MGLSGIAQGALMVLGVGILAERFGAGTGLESLGSGITRIAAAPLGGVGMGFSGLATGLRDIAESFGDIGRGLGALFENIPTGPITGIPWSPVTTTPEYTAPYTAGPKLIPVSGGDQSTTLAGGGGNVSLRNAPITSQILGGIEVYTFPGAGTYWKTERAAMKNYADYLQGAQANNV